MKSKQELIDKWESAIEAADFYGKGKEERLISYMKDFVSDLNQLDEPETVEQTTHLLESVLRENKRLGKLLEEKHEEWLELMDEINNQETLSEYWIEQKSIDTHVDTLNGEVQVTFRLDDLQNLLVPKQEEVTHKQVEKYLLDRNIRVIDIDVYEKMQSNLAEFENKIVIEKPVIPKFVADWIEKYVEYGYDLYPALKKMENNARSWERTYDWYRNNTLEFVLAYLTQEYEIEVEEEQKYYVLFGNQPHDDNWTYALTNSGSIEIFEKDVLPEWDRTKLTEQEIKDYDERFWAFRKPVEELEG